jgi:hypothetical protein
MNLVFLAALGFMKAHPTRSLRRLKRIASAIALMAAMPAAFAIDFGTRLEQLLAVQPMPLFVVLQTNGVIEVPLNVQQMADEMPARVKKANADALWFDVLVLVASPVSPTKANVVFEFKTRCAVAPATAYEQQVESQNALLSGMSTLVKLAQDRRLNLQWGAICPVVDDSVEAAYRRVMRFPALGMQVMATTKLAYLTSINSSLMFTF